MRQHSYVLFFSVLGFCTACGGGGGSDGGRLVEGTLTEAGQHAAQKIVPKHSAGEPLEQVQVCALSECSVTDAKGQWGLLLPENTAGDVVFRIEGHGINTTTTLTLPPGNSDLTFELLHVEGGAVELAADE